ncbi:hypothetical protein JOF29_001917 [Kribbella aluminosa]|uniref:Secreted protein n=1 Tax=Kribbella aluminosa TaxID=416017 RepID=A0ABS4UGT5_9ACTN|nr:hypothetical protein [Kribbella aluminosa]MBP2350834.1 hypothetical protein [Kribbella aluminosa]
MIKHGRILAAGALLAGALVAGALVAGALVTTPAGAAPTGSTASCSLRLGSVTSGGDHTLQTITAAPSAGARTVGPNDLYPDGETGLASSVRYEPVAPAGEQRQGLVTIVDQLYNSTYLTDGTGTAAVPGTVKSTHIGGGWKGVYFWLDRSDYSAAGVARSNLYALHSVPGDADIVRWRLTAGGPQYKTVFGGFKAVKTMALIGQGRTSDTFLAITNGGALYTVQVPTGSGKPVVTKVRTSTWQVFGTLIAERCGQQGTLLLGIDRVHGTGYLYAVGHANGAATVIKGLGKVPSALSPTEPYFRYYNAGTVLNGA